MILSAGKLDEVQPSSTSSRLPAGSIIYALYHKLQTQSSAPEDGRNYRPKHVELIGIINKPLFLHLVGCLCYCFGKYMNFKNEMTDFGAGRDESWMSVAIVFVSS